MCTGKFQFRKPGAVEQNQRTEKFGRPPPVFFRTSILPYDQQGAQETSKRETAEIQGGFCFEGTIESGGSGERSLLGAMRTIGQPIQITGGSG